MTSPPPSRRMRSDARANRERIIAAARELLAEQGGDAATEAVARRAGIGVGTVYRHFPHKAALVRGVALDSFESVVANARDAEDEEPDAWRALDRFVRRSATELQMATWISIWFASTWEDLRADPENGRLRRLLLKSLDRIVTRAQLDGDLRPDVDAVDVALLLAALVRPVPGLPSHRAQHCVDRHLILMLDGLRARPDTTNLPDSKVRLEDLAEDGPRV